MSETTVFGKRVPKRSKIVAALAVNWQKKRYGFEGQKGPRLAWEPEQDEPWLRRVIAAAGEDQGQPLAGGVTMGTVRMGYGHLRMARTAATWARAMGVPVNWLDLIGIGTRESQCIADIDKVYSRLTRFADRFGPAGALWGRLSRSAGWGSLHMSIEQAKLLAPLLDNYDPTIPMVSAYVTAGLLAVHAGVRRVVHLVPDNLPMPFFLVPGAINLVQGGQMYTSYLEMGLPREAFRLVGHWVPYELAVNAEADGQARIARRDGGLPVRLLMSLGGAGVQADLFEAIIRHLGRPIREGKAALLINAGDHGGVAGQFARAVESLKLPLATYNDFTETQAFASRYVLRPNPPEVLNGVHLFSAARVMPAVAATDLLIRCADVLVTKPSELAFLPIPKLFLRRVGDHEMAAAIRSSELGDGLPECRDLAATANALNMVVNHGDTVRRLAEGVIRLASQGIYHGSKRAIEIAMEQPA